MPERTPPLPPPTPCPSPRPPVVGAYAAPIVAAVAVKLPAFWAACPSLWFRQAEGIFTNRTPALTRDETKFNYVLEVLPNAVIERVAAVVENPPAQDKFDTIKAALLADSHFRPPT